MFSTFIPTSEVIRNFGYLIKAKGKVSGLNFAKAILKSGVDCKYFRENNASTAASISTRLRSFNIEDIRAWNFFKELDLTTRLFTIHPKFKDYENQTQDNIKGFPCESAGNHSR